MASGFNYKDIPIDEFLSPFNENLGFTESTSSSKWEGDHYYDPMCTSSFMKKNFLNDNIYANSDVEISKEFTGSNLDNLARRGSCPPCLTDIAPDLNLITILDGDSVYHGTDETGRYGIIKIYRSSSYRLSYSETDQELQLYSNDTWHSVPNSKYSKIVIIDIVGGGGGGGGSGIDDDADEDDVTGGGGGGGGGFLSVLANVSTDNIDYLQFEVGEGGTGGAGGRTTGGAGGDGTNGEPTYIRTPDNAVIACAHGGFGGAGGAGDSDEGMAAGGGWSKVSKFYPLTGLTGVSFIKPIRRAYGGFGGAGGDQVDEDEGVSSGSYGCGFYHLDEYSGFDGMYSGPVVPYFTNGGGRGGTGTVNKLVKAISGGGGGGASVLGPGCSGVSEITETGQEKHNLVSSIGGGGFGGTGWCDLNDKTFSAYGLNGSDGGVLIYYELS